MSEIIGFKKIYIEDLPKENMEFFITQQAITAARDYMQSLVKKKKNFSVFPGEVNNIPFREMANILFNTNDVFKILFDGKEMSQEQQLIFAEIFFKEISKGSKIGES